MHKAILFDADGVVLKKYKEYFSERFAKKYNVPIGEIRQFFNGDFKKCQRGKLDLKEEIAKYLPNWNWADGVDAFLEYWFTTDVALDEKAMDKVEKARNKGLKCYLVTDQEKYRGNYIIEKFDFKNKFDKCFISCDLGYFKSEPEFFIEISKITGMEPADFLYLDDDQKNVDIANSLGIKSYFYGGISDLEKIDT